VQRGTQIYTQEASDSARIKTLRNAAGELQARPLSLAAVELAITALVRSLRANKQRFRASRGFCIGLGCLLGQP
jgi:hypothetical protein